MEKWIRQEEIHKGRIFSLWGGEVSLDSGETAVREYIRHPGGVAVVPVRGENVILIRQFRIAVGRELVELPAGRLEPGDEPHQRAARELEEETGYRPGLLIPITSYFASDGNSNERIYIFLAMDLDRGEVRLEHDERIQVVIEPFQGVFGHVGGRRAAPYPPGRGGSPAGAGRVRRRTRNRSAASVGRWLTMPMPSRRPEPVTTAAASPQRPTIDALGPLIRRIQSSFVNSAEPHRVFDALLPDLLALGGSEYGFIAEVWRDADGAPFLKIFTMTNIAWDAASRAMVERERLNGIEFRNLKTLFGAGLVTGEPVIANDAPNDPRSGGGLPRGHTPLNTFLGMPLHYGGAMVGMIGLANRRPGYDQALLDALDPLFQSMAGIIAAVQLDRQRRAAEAALGEREAHWRASFEQAGVGVAQVGPDGRFIEVNARMCELTGRTRAELLTMRVRDVTHPDDLPGDIALLQRPLVQQDGRQEQREKRYLRPDGSAPWVQVTVTPIRDAQGRFKHTMSIVLDIDQRKRAEQALREREAAFTKLADRVPGVLLQFHIDTAGHATGR